MARQIPTDDLSRAGASSFTGLDDTPASLAGEALRRVRVNAGGTALEFVDAPNPVFGNGFNALMVVDVGGVLTPTWVDIQSIVQLISGGSDQFVILPTKVIPVPAQAQTAVASLATASAHSEAITTPIPTQTAIAEIV